MAGLWTDVRTRKWFEWQPKDAYLDVKFHGVMQYNTEILNLILN